MSDAELTAHAVELRRLVDELAANYVGNRSVQQDEATEGDPQHPGRSRLWVYSVRIAGAAGTAVEPAAALSADGWTVTDRSGPAIAATQLQRDGFDIGITAATDAGGDVVVGGSSPAVRPG